MQDANDRPSMNMSAVVRETGVQPDTLRAWERRYGLPLPGRSDGGHRLYSRHDVETVKWLRDRQEEGMRISQAVALWESLLDEDKDPLQLTRFATPETHLTDVELEPAMEMARLRQAWTTACASYDEARAENVLAQAFAVYPPEAVCSQLIQKGLEEIGEAWYIGETSVQQEHFASELAVRRLETMLAATPAPTRPSRILVACPPFELHRFAPLLLTLLLRRAGWEAIDLGENVPLERLQKTVEAARPNLVILTAQTLPTAATLLQMANLLNEMGQASAFGGLIFNRVPSLRERIPGVFLGERLELATEKVEQTLASLHPPIDFEPAPEVWRAAAELLHAHELEFQVRVRQLMQGREIHPDHLSIAISGLIQTLSACLQLGDTEPLEAEMTWIRGLLDHRQIDEHVLVRVIYAFREAAEEELPSGAEPLLELLDRASRLFEMNDRG